MAARPTERAATLFRIEQAVNCEGVRGSDGKSGDCYGKVLERLQNAATLVHAAVLSAL